MANVEHNTLTDPELHEPKGVAAATAGQVYVADGAASGDWTAQDPAYAQGYIEGNSTATSIATVDTPVAVNFGGAFSSDLTNKFTISVNGEFTYTGTPTVVVRVTANLFADQASAATKEYTFFIAKNDTVIASSTARIETDGSVGDSGTVSSLVSVATNDVLEVWVENNTDTTNITVSNASVSVSQLGF